jgi:DNA-binding CsgD family transcriptional regulator
LSVPGEDQELLERHGEVALVEAGVAAAAAGRGGLLWIEGRAGIGKTELVRWARQAAARAGFGVCSARGGELEREFPFGVVRQLFEGVVRNLEPADQTALLSGAARQAASALGLSRDVAVPDVLPVLHGLYWLTVNMTTTRPLLVAVDDAHWADVASLRYLEYLARRLDELPVLVVVASRPTEPHSDPDVLARVATEATSQAIRPSPLTEDAVARLVGGYLDGPADREFVRACHEATNGNPFLVRHLVAALREDGVVSSAASAPAVFTTAPDTVARATRTRLASLPPEATRLAEAVAVLGDDTQFVMAAALAETDASLAATASDQLAAIGVLRPSRPLAFVHPLLRAVVSTGIPTGRRSALHRRAAGLLADARGPADRIAAQLLGTEPAGDPWVAEMLRAGAAAALAAGDPATAGVFLQRALAEPAPAELRPALLYELGAAEHRLHSPSAIDDLREAYGLAGDAHQRVEILRVLMLALMGAGRAEEVEPLLDPAIEAVVTVDPDLALQLEAEVLSVARLSARNQIWSQARLERWRGKRLARTPGERLLLAILCNQIAISGGTASEAAWLAEQALGDGVLLSEQTADAQPYYLAAYVLAAAGRLARAAGLLDTARADAVARGSELGFAMASVFRSYVEFAAGRIREAEAEAANAIRAARDEHVWPAGFPACVAAMLDVLAVQGRTSEAEHLLEHHDLAGSLPDSLPHRALLHSRGQLRLVAGDAQRALDDFDEFDRREAPRAAINPWLNNHCSGAIVARARLGQTDEARDRARAGLEAAKQWGTNHAVGRALLALGITSPAGEADTHLAEAVAILAGSPFRLDHVAALVELGALRRRSGARKAAETTLRDSLDLAARLGAGLLVERARGELVAMGRRPRRTAVTGLDALTGSERRVADLAATGMTNRDIAQSLFVTTRTVEIHLSAVYRKLGIDSRSRLGDALSPPP